MNKVLLSALILLIGLQAGSAFISSFFGGSNSNNNNNQNKFGGNGDNGSELQKNCVFILF